MFRELTDPFRYKKIAVLEKENLKKTADDAKKPKVKSKNWAGTLRRIWNYLAEEKGLLFLVLLMVILSSVLGLLGPFLLGRGIDQYIVERSNSGFAALLAGLAAIYIVYSASLW
ncbi:hypothetical protein B14911_17925, partial [Bacillus sp. NRRL B-14911]